MNPRTATRLLGPIGAMLTLVATAGCSSGSSSPLVGTWMGSVARQSGLTVQFQITFHPNYTMDVQDTAVYPTTAFAMQGCTESDESTGYTWSVSDADGGADGGAPTVTIDQSNVYRQTTYQHCVHAADDTAIPAMPDNMVLSSNSTQPYAYTLTGNTLTLTPTSVGGYQIVLTRQ